MNYDQEYGAAHATAVNAFFCGGYFDAQPYAHLLIIVIVAHAHKRFMHI
jgi:hypothetical protein